MPLTESTIADVFEQAKTYLDDTLKTNVSRTVRYRRGAAYVDVAAEISTTKFEVREDEGITDTWESDDYLIATADLVLGGSRVEPQRGDTIEDVIDGREYNMAVTPPANDQAYRFTDHYRTKYRIHTKQIYRSPL